MPRCLFPIVLVLSGVLAWQQPAGMALAAGGDGAVKATRIPGTSVATEQKPATVKVQDAANGGALEVTARPVAGAAASPGYLVGVFEEGQPGSASPKLLGSFSFYPPRAGVAQTFVIPMTEFDKTGSKGTVTLSIKLIPANPAADIKDAAVEILGARMLK